MARFPRSARLLDPAAFQQVFSRGKRISLNGLTAVVAPNALGQPRLGLAIAKKSVRRAVARNRIKRLIREAFRARQAGLVAVDIVLLARPGIERTEAGVLRAELDRLWLRLRADA